jgi:hypothetical protein
MQVKEIKKVVLELEDEEILIFINALKYVKHRIGEHGSKGALSVCSYEKVRKMLNEYANILSNS